MDWNGWTMPKIVVVFVSLAFLMMWVQVFLMHGRSAFHRREQYIPVLEAPFLVLSGAWLALAPSSLAYWVYVVFHALGALTGMMGFYLHMGAAGARVGGLTLRNLMGGPPVLIPMMYGALAALGVLAAWWGLAGAGR